LRELEKLQQDREHEIQILYLESLGYPVKIEPASQLMLILQKRDLASAIIKHLNGKSTLKNIKKILSKDYSHLNIENDKDLKVLYDKLKVDKYEYSTKITENLNNILEQKKDVSEFAKLLQYAEENNMCIERVEAYKKAMDDFVKWENKVKIAIANKLEKDIMCNLQNEYQYLAFSSKLSNTLNEIIHETDEWQKKALKFINEGANSGILETDLIAEGHNLRCRTPIIDYLEKRRAGTSWGALPTQRNTPSGPFQC